jgi:hypothetical protein
MSNSSFPRAESVSESPAPRHGVQAHHRVRVVAVHTGSQRSSARKVYAASEPRRAANAFMVAVANQATSIPVEPVGNGLPQKG